MLIALFLLSVPQINTVEASSTITYCPKGDWEVCQDPKYDLESFLNSIGSPQIVDGYYLYIESDHFTYYIPLWIIEARFDPQYYIDDDFTNWDWDKYDHDSNMVPDLYDDYIDEFESDYDWFYDDFHLDMWWDSSNKIPVIFDYLGEGYYGKFGWGADEYYPTATEHMVINPFEDKPAVIGTIAHEMFHAVQYGYVQDMSVLDTSSFAEGTATMIETKLPNNSDLIYMELQGTSALEMPEQSIFGALNTDWGETPSYGSYLWYSYLYQAHGGKSIVKAMLEAFSSLEKNDSFSEYLVPYYSFVALSLALESQGEDIAEVYREFTIQNYDKDFYTDSKYLGDVKILETHMGSSGSELIDEEAPALFGSNYIKFDVPSKNGYFELNFLGSSDAKYNITIMPIENAESVDEKHIAKYTVDSGDSAYYNFYLDDIDELHSLVLIVSPIDSGLITKDIFNDYVFPYSYSFRYVDSVSETSIVTLSSDSTTIFNDVDVQTSNSTAISYLKDKGIISGYSDGSFKPENSLNRAELLKILVEGKGYSPDANVYKDCFPDVTTDWYAKYACYAKEQGWVEGYPDGTFQPSKNVNKVEAVKMLLEIFATELQAPSTEVFSDVSSTEWYSKYVYTANNLGLLEESGTYAPSNDITRGGISENIYRLLIK